MSDRLLFLERFLMENTDEDTTVSTRDILDAYLEARNTTHQAKKIFRHET